ncbi:spore coat protein F [Paenibacillus sp. cl141a]|nr:spore coat protein F [Paenibacillus sp. cl141a]
MSHNPSHLAWHETLEIHELTAFQANHLMAFKMSVHDVKDHTDCIWKRFKELNRT